MRLNFLSVATADSLAMPAFSMALSSPSEYEKPPTGKAGEASHISCKKLAAGREAVIRLSVVTLRPGNYFSY